MISTTWIAKRKPHWQRLQELLAQVSKSGLRSLSRSQLCEFGYLYRQVSADLSVVREDHTARQLELMLNKMLLGAHNALYTGKKSSPRQLLHYFRYEYPVLFRRLLAYTTTATLLFVGGAIIGWVLTTVRPEFMHRLLGPGMVMTIERHEMWTHSLVSMKPIAASGIMTNNLSVTFMTYASGIVAGIGTVYLVVFNGLLLGVVGAACAAAGMSKDLWSFIAPHGVLELPAIFIAGGSGLRLAQGLLFPGTYSRRDALALAGAESVRLMSGTIPLLVIAGTIEGFVSPTHLAVGLKFAFAAAVLILLASYLFLVNERSERIRERPAL